MRLIGVGEILWDVIGEREHLGGAVFNLCTQVAELGHEVYLISAVGADQRGQLALERAAGLRVRGRFLKTVAKCATGMVTVAVDGSGEPSYTIHRPAAYDYATLEGADYAELERLNPDWIAFGTLFLVQPNGKRLLTRILDRLPGARRFYDVNLRNESFTAGLVLELLALADIVKMNAAEAAVVREMMGWPAGSLEEFCRRASEQFDCECVSVTRGAQGCALLLADIYAEAPAVPIQVVDAVGAGDAFAAALIHAIEEGKSAAEAAEFANRMGAKVASRPGAVPES